MRIAFVIFILSLGAWSIALADQFVFQYHRFGGITIETTPGKEHVIIEYGEKDSPVETIFKSRLLSAGPGVYKTPKGTFFRLEHLSKPIINDGNRRINSGDWKLTVSGSGKEFAKLKPKMPAVAFGDTPLLVYLGEKFE